MDKKYEKRFKVGVKIFYIAILLLFLGGFVLFSGLAGMVFPTIINLLGGLSATIGIVLGIVAIALTNYS